MDTSWLARDLTASQGQLWDPRHRAWLQSLSLLLLHSGLSQTAEYDFLKTAFPAFKITLSPI